MHAVLGALTLAALAVHTGGRLGSNLNFVLIASFLGVVALGSVAGGVIALEHRLGAARRAAAAHLDVDAHPARSGRYPCCSRFHVFKTYYF